MTGFSGSTEVADRADQVILQGMDLVNLFVNKNYLIDVDKCDPVPMDAGSMDYQLLSLVYIDKIVYDEKENINDKLVSVYSALSNFGSTAMLFLKSDGSGVKLYFGVRDESRPYVAKEILVKSLRGNFPGIQLQEVPDEEEQKILEDSFPPEYSSKAVTSVSIVPSLRDDDKDRFVQGLEKFIDTMAGEEYSAIFIAEPLDKDALETKKRGYEELYTALSQCSELQLTYSENESTSVADGVSKGFSQAVNEGISDTTGTNKGKNSNRGYSHNHGMSFGLFGTGMNFGGGSNSGHGSYTGTSQSHTDTSSETRTDSTTESRTDTRTNGSSGSIQISRKNKTVLELMDNIDEQLQRIRNCESYGLWNAACYFVSVNEETAIVAANTYKALVAGEKTNVENSFINVWSSDEDDMDRTVEILNYLRFGMHPEFRYRPEFADSGYDGQVISAASMISGVEIPLLMGFPHKSVNGVTSVVSAEFGRNVYSKNPMKPRRIIDLGCVYHMGMLFRKNRVRLNLDNLTSHCFICGSTGSGKSNTTYKIIDELMRPVNHVNFLVIEPAKGEYKKDFGNLPGINIFTTNPRFYSMLAINPFAFPEDVHVLEHLDRLIEIFSACWPLYAAMPAVLKQSFERAYIRHGWDLNNSRWIDLGNGKYPTFRDVCEMLPVIMDESEFSAETRGNYVGSLVTRVTSLTNGLVGQIFGGVPVDDRILFDENTIVDLSRVGSAETKALIMGVLVLKLSEYRQSTQKGTNLPLQHVTIMEEAHNLLKRVSTEQGQEGANVQGKSVEMISSSIAEMRTYGEGFLIVDQSPTSVDASAIKNTNTKIVMNLPEAADCEEVGHAMGLREDQIAELSKLDKGVAAVFQNDWLEAVLTKVDKCSDEFVKDHIDEQDFTARHQMNGDLLDELLREDEDGDFNIAWLKDPVEGSRADSSYKNAIMQMLRTYQAESARDRDGSGHEYLFSKLIVDILNCADLPEIFVSMLPMGKFKKASELTQEQIDQARLWIRKMKKALGPVQGDGGPEGYAVFYDEETRDKTLGWVIIYELYLHRKDRYLYGYQAVKFALDRPDYRAKQQKQEEGDE